MHEKLFSIQIFQYFRQIPPRVCTLVLFIDVISLASFPSSSCLVLVRGFIDILQKFDVGLIQLSLHIVCSHIMQAKVFSIQMFQYFSQIALRFCTNYLFFH